MLPHTKILVEITKLTRALQADTNLYPVTIMIRATPSGVLEAGVKRDNDQHEMAQTQRAIQHYVNKFSKARAAANPDQTLRRRRPTGGGSIVQVENPQAALRELAKLMGGAMSGPDRGQLSMSVQAKSQEDLQRVFDSLHSV